MKTRCKHGFRQRLRPDCSFAAALATLDADTAQRATPPSAPWVTFDAPTHHGGFTDPEGRMVAGSHPS